MVSVADANNDTFLDYRKAVQENSRGNIYEQMLKKAGEEMKKTAELAGKGDRKDPSMNKKDDTVDKRS
jgi:hypothetical protein